MASVEYSPRLATNQLLTIFRDIESKGVSETDMKAGKIFLRHQAAEGLKFEKISFFKGIIIWWRGKNDYNFEKNLSVLLDLFNRSLQDMKGGLVSPKEKEQIVEYANYYQRLVESYAQKKLKGDPGAIGSFVDEYSIEAGLFQKLQDMATGPDLAERMLSWNVCKFIDDRPDFKKDLQRQFLIKVMVSDDVLYNATRLNDVKDRITALGAEVPQELIKEYQSLRQQFGEVSLPAEPLGPIDYDADSFIKDFTRRVEIAEESLRIFEGKLEGFKDLATLEQRRKALLADESLGKASEEKLTLQQRRSEVSNRVATIEQRQKDLLAEVQAVNRRAQSLNVSELRPDGAIEVSFTLDTSQMSLQGMDDIASALASLEERLADQAAAIKAKSEELEAATKSRGLKVEAVKARVGRLGEDIKGLEKRAALLRSLASRLGSKDAESVLSEISLLRAEFDTTESSLAHLSTENVGEVEKQAGALEARVKSSQEGVERLSEVLGQERKALNARWTRVGQRYEVALSTLKARRFTMGYQRTLGEFLDKLSEAQRALGGLESRLQSIYGCRGTLDEAKLSDVARDESELGEIERGLEAQGVVFTEMDEDLARRLRTAEAEVLRRLQLANVEGDRLEASITALEEREKTDGVAEESVRLALASRCAAARKRIQHALSPTPVVQETRPRASGLRRRYLHPSGGGGEARLEEERAPAEPANKVLADCEVEFEALAKLVKSRNAVLDTQREKSREALLRQQQAVLAQLSIVEGTLTEIEARVDALGSSTVVLGQADPLRKQIKDIRQEIANGRRPISGEKPSSQETVAEAEESLKRCNQQIKDLEAQVKAREQMFVVSTSFQEVQRQHAALLASIESLKQRAQRIGYDALPRDFGESVQREPQAVKIIPTRLARLMSADEIQRASGALESWKATLQEQGRVVSGLEAMVGKFAEGSRMSIVRQATAVKERAEKAGSDESLKTSLRGLQEQARDEKELAADTEELQRVGIKITQDEARLSDLREKTVRLAESVKAWGASHQGPVAQTVFEKAKADVDSFLENLDAPVKSKTVRELTEEGIGLSRQCIPQALDAALKIEESRQVLLLRGQKLEPAFADIRERLDSLAAMLEDERATAGCKVLMAHADEARQSLGGVLSGPPSGLKQFEGKILQAERDLNALKKDEEAFIVSIWGAWEGRVRELLGKATACNLSKMIPGINLKDFLSLSREDRHAYFEHVARVGSLIKKHGAQLKLIQKFFDTELFTVEDKRRNGLSELALTEFCLGCEALQILEGPSVQGSRKKNELDPEIKALLLEKKTAVLERVNTVSKKIVDFRKRIDIAGRSCEGIKKRIPLGDQTKTDREKIEELSNRLVNIAKKARLGASFGSHSFVPAYDVGRTTEPELLSASIDRHALEVASIEKDLQALSGKYPSRSGSPV